jgi:hypothetical protein
MRAGAELCAASFLDVMQQTRLIYSKLRRWCWALFYRFPNQLSYAEKAELVSFVDEFELRSGVRTPPGYDPHVRCIRLNMDPIRTIHRPMIVYCGVAVFNSLSKVVLSSLLGFRRMRLGGFNYWFRPATCNHPHHHQYDDTAAAATAAGGAAAAGADNASGGHQHCPKMPIVFLHGLGTEQELLLSFPFCGCECD